MGGRKKKDETVKKDPGRVSSNMLGSHKMAIVGQLFRGVAHDMKNPLAVILQGSEFLEYSKTLDDSAKKIIGMIRKAASRIDMTIENVMGFARPSAGKAQLTDVRTLIDESLALLGSQLSNSFVQVAKDFPQSIPECMVNRDEIRHALVGVLMNAADAIPEDGIVSIEVRQVLYESGKSSVAVMVTDNGCGIPEDNLGRIFDPFFTTKKDLGRMGLGLTITRDIVERHNGHLSIESKEGKGTSVLMVLPAE